ncbi:MAG TPA: VRR-NUC domain-containing protein [Methylomicrobium sp.]|nr:VRR-NUC domain-containing protein [Methylomicrobium sp.]
MEKALNYTENDLDKAITEYLRWALPRDAVSFHIPNGGYKLSGKELGRLKASGYVAGIPDRCVMWNGIICWIEIKRLNGRLNPAQVDMFLRFERAGFPVTIARSIEDVRDALKFAGIPINNMLL